MALEDFFTLTEMNNGLTALDRVKELVGLMHKAADFVINNISDSTRQWSAVASAIAATENEDCLLLFVQLDGLIYMNRWLKDASDFVNKESDSFVEETVIDLLKALTRIEVVSDNLVGSGIWMTVKNLLGHNNPKVLDMAKSLFEMWNKEKPRESVTEGEDIGIPDNAEIGVSERHAGENGNLGPSVGDIDASQGSLTSEIRPETANSGLLSTASESLKDEDINKKSSDGAICNEDMPHSTNTKSFPEPVDDNLDKLEPPVSCSEETPSSEACSVVGPKPGIQKEVIHGSELDPSRTEKLTQKMGSSPQMFDKEQDPKGTLSSNDTGTLHSVIEPSDIKNDNSEEKDCVGEVTNCQKTAASEAEKKMNDDKSSDYDRNIMELRMKGGGEHNNNVLEASNSNTSELKPKNFKGSGKLFHRTGNLGVIEGRIHDKVEGCLAKDYDFSKRKTRRKDHSIEMKSDFDLDNGIADPLELARMVAIEIEREVEDRELSCSSSDQEMSSKLQPPERSHSITGELCQAESSTAGVPTQPDLSDSPTREDHVTSAQSLDSGSQEARSPQVTEVAHVVKASTDEGICHFDLNQDICLEDVEHQGDTASPPVSIVSASRAAAAPSMPVGPLQFEGSLGWKGSATTSAFRPASSRKAPESDFALSAGWSNGSSKENYSLLNFDLNVAESGDVKKIPISFQFDPLESSAEGSSRSERMEFDLNRVSDEGAPLHMQLEQDLFHRRSGLHSSSSSSKQPSLINFDLNDQPTVASDLSIGRFYPKPSQSLIASGSVKSDDSVISIMGRRVEVNRRDSSMQPIPFSNGRIPEPTIGFNLERPGGPFAMGSSTSYPHPHIHGFNGLPLGYSIPFSSPIYNSDGSIPYMVDSRGAPVVPQIMPSPAIASAFPQPPYLFNMPGMPSVNDVGLSRDNFDLNSGMYTEGSGRDHGGFRQLFNPQLRPFDEHLKANSQPSTSLGIGVGGKRKEPEGGWESYPFNHDPQPWR